MMQQMFLGELYDSLLGHFDDEKLRDLCFRLAVVYEDLPGTTRAAKARELVQRADREGRLVELAEAVRSRIPPGERPPLLRDEPRDLLTLLLIQRSTTVMERLLLAIERIEPAFEAIEARLGGIEARLARLEEADQRRSRRRKEPPG